MMPPQCIRNTVLLLCLVGVASIENKSKRIQSRRIKSYKNASAPNNHRSNLRRTAEWMSYPRVSPQPRIVNGNDAPSPDRYPYYVALVDDRERIVCGGSLIASNVVLTAAHCGLTNLRYAVLGKYYGQIDTQQEHSEAECIPISNTFSNPRFTLRDRSHDQLLVLLESPAESTRSIVRLNLSEGGDSNIPKLSDRVTVLGLGQTSTSTQPSSDPPQVLQQVTMGVVSNGQCQNMYDKHDFVVPSISNDMVCLNEELKGQCYGDSGGPYLLLGDKPEDDIQIGSVSWGIDCANEKYPAVGIRTYSGGDSFLIDTTCSIAVKPPDYMQCQTRATQLSTPSPTTKPTETSNSSPTQAPSVLPSIVRSSTPTNTPSAAPSRAPTNYPTLMASNMPTRAPTASPTRLPTATPTVMASDMPTKSPSSAPTKVRSDRPSSAPSTSPSIMESDKPTSPPSIFPTVASSGTPSVLPSASPSTMPSKPFPSASPTTCVQRANFCTKGDTCCGMDICYGGFCRPVPNTSKQSAGYYKEDLKLKRATSSGIRGSYQSIGILDVP